MSEVSQKPPPPGHQALCVPLNDCRAGELEKPLRVPAALGWQPPVRSPWAPKRREGPSVASPQPGVCAPLRFQLHFSSAPGHRHHPHVAEQAFISS